MSSLGKILIVDDEKRSVESLTRALDREFEVLAASTAEEAMALLDEHKIKVILCDNRMPGTSGVELLAQVRQQWPDVVRLLISAYSDVEDIIDSINSGGIYQFIAKPWNPNNLMVILKNVVMLYDLQKENALLVTETRLTTDALREHNLTVKKKLKENFHINSIYRSPESPLNQACEQLIKVAPYDISVLLTGESGTGKEMFARALHYNSGRAEKPFVAENCAALTDEFLSSELFGHKKGAFTGAVTDHVGLLEQADGGTVFLDEIGDVTPGFQLKLLRVLQEGEFRPLGGNQSRKVDIRIVAATNRNLEEDVKAGRFRGDLYYRLATVSINLLPLRQRRVDIPLIAEQVLANSMSIFGKQVKGFTPEALAMIQAFDWPGNVRELQNEVQRCLVLSAGPWIEVEDLSPKLRQKAPAQVSSGSLAERVQQLEEQMILDAMSRHHQNKTKVAEELGLSRVGLRAKLERYQLGDGVGAS
ncbi:MAG: sigma-54 dependent transcriptional regulator [bacterium]|nr:sigma-54 dependent transcriptional regulator [bacterium]